MTTSDASRSDRTNRPSVPHIETARLTLRRPLLADVPSLFAFLGDAEAMRYTQVDPSVRDCRRRVAAHERRRRRDGVAPWTILTKSDGRIVGWGGLYVDPFDPDWGIEVGYFFHPSVWHRGFASELTAASVALADDVLGLAAVIAFAHPENLGSRRVLEKAGFGFVEFVPAMNRLLFRRDHGARPALADTLGLGAR